MGWGCGVLIALLVIVLLAVVIFYAIELHTCAPVGCGGGP